MSKEKIDADVRELVGKFGNTRVSLMSILHELQKKYHEVPDHAMQTLADMLGIHAIEVQDVVTFYHYFSTKEHGKYTIRMCHDMPCKMQGAKEVAASLEKELAIKFGETTEDGLFTLEWTSCIGMCDQGPAFLVNDEPYIRVNPKEVAHILDKYTSEK